MRPLHAAIAGTHADVVLYLLSIPCDTTVKVLYEGLQFDAFELVEAVTGDETNSTRKAMVVRASVSVGHQCDELGVSGLRTAMWSTCPSIIWIS